MKLYELLSKELKTDEITLTEEEVILYEGALFKVSPFIALTAFKQSALKALSIGLHPLKAAGDLVKTGIAKGKIAKERFKSKIGASGKEDNDTVYKFTKEQREFLATLMRKYGKQIVSAIEKYRSEILAPYQVIKRLVKENRTLTSKETHDMTREEYLRYRESGRKKIEGRSEHDTRFKGSQEDMKIAKEGYSSALKELEDFKDPTKRRRELNETNLEKAFKLMELGTDKLQGYTRDELHRTYKRINYYKDIFQYNIDNYEDITTIYDKNGNEIDILKNLTKKFNELNKKGITRTEIGEPNVRSKEGDTITKGDFSKALPVYLLRNDIRKEFEEDFGSSTFKRFYIQVLENLVKEAREKKDEVLKGMVKVHKDVELNSMEKKIWKRKAANFEKYSTDINDYYLALDDEDFKGVKHYKVPEAVKEAENTINRERKRFERKLEDIVGEDNVKELNRLRLINNLITVKDLKSPETLFKSKEELEDYYDDEDEIDDEYIDDKEEEKTPEPQPEKETEDNRLKAEEVKTVLNSFLTKSYNNPNEYKRDRTSAVKLINKFRKHNPAANEELQEINELFNQFDTKFQQQPEVK